MIHTIKILVPYADAIIDGRKTFEVRKNDRGYNAGDIVDFRVVDSVGLSMFTHPLNEKQYEITYVHSGLGLEKDYVVFGIKKKESEEEE